MNIDAISVGPKPPYDIHVVIEIPAGGLPVKYEMDKESGALFVDRFLNTAMYYPGNYGFIPHTLADDGDPCDVIVINPTPVVPGAVIRARPIGVLLMEDEAGRDEKILAVPVDKLNPYYSDIQSYTQLPKILIEQIEHFFTRYKDLEKGKMVRVDKWAEADVAAELIETGMKMHEEAQAALVQAEAGVKAAQAALKAARINLEFTRIAAPISGRIGRSSVTEGALVAPGQATELATIQRIDPIYVDVVQSSLELTRLKRRFISGDMAPASTRVSLRMEDGLPYPHAGTLKFTEVAVDAATGSVTLRAEFPNPQGLLLPGMYVRAQVESGVERQAVLAPQRGVSRNEKGEPTALVIGAGDKVELRALEVRSAAGDQWIVTGGLREGDRLVVDGRPSAVQLASTMALGSGTLAACASANHFSNWRNGSRARSFSASPARV